MDTTTLLIIIIVVLVLLGGGWSPRRYDGKFEPFSSSRSKVNRKALASCRR